MFSREMDTVAVLITALLSLIMTQKCDAHYASCTELKRANAQATSGEHEMENANGQRYKVYCEFRGDHGYMFIPVTTSIPIDMRDYCYSRSQVLVRHLRTNRLQFDTTMSQIVSQHDVTLSIQYNKTSNYQGPQNAARMAPYLFLGFIPEKYSRQRNTQGYSANGKDFTFRNCDANPNSYLAFFFNPNNRQPTSYHTRCCYTKLMRNWIEEGIPAFGNLPWHYFFQFEMHMGGCGGYAVNGYNTLQDIVGAALGIRFELE